MEYILRGKKTNRRIIKSEGVAPDCVAFSMDKKDIADYMRRYSAISIHKIQLTK